MPFLLLEAADKLLLVKEKKGGVSCDILCEICPSDAWMLLSESQDNLLIQNIPGTMQTFVT